MTLALAICCRDGIVFGADSQSTISTAGQPTRHDTEKLNVLGGRIAWAGSGTVGAIQRVQPELGYYTEAILDAFARSPELGAREIFRHVNAVQKQVASEVLSNEDGGGGSSYLFGGYGAAGQFLLEISSDGVRQWSHRSGFTAIGSGDIFAIHAYRSVSHYRLRSLSLVQALALAYRTVENAIATAAFGLGGAVKLATVTVATASLLDDTQIKAVQDTVDIWKQREVEILAELAPGPAEHGSGDDAPAEPPHE